MFGKRHTIGELRVHGAGRDDAALRLAVNRDLDSCIERPRGMPPSAILIVRRITDPMPGVVGAASIDRRRQASWNSALRQSLDEWLARARRPDEHGVVTDGDAVLFAEEGEMIAALVRAVAAGGSHPWWCKLLLRRFCGSGRPSLLPLLGSEVHRLPAVVDTLADWDALRPVADRLQDPDAVQLMRALTRAFDLVYVHERIEGRANITVVYDAGDSEAVEELNLDRNILAALTRASGSLPKRAHVAAVVDLALTLQRRPSYARTKDYARRLSHLWHGTTVRDSPDLPRTRPDPGRATERTPYAADEDRQIADGPVLCSDEALVSDAHESSNVVDGADEVSAAAKDSSSTRRAGPIGAAQPSGPSAPDEANNRHAKNGGAVDAVSMGDAPENTTAVEPVPARSAAWQGEGVPTEWGGVLFLINLFDHLKIPQCFEPAWELAQRLGPWTLLELIGTALVEDDGVGDGMWATLAELDGRDPHGAFCIDCVSNPEPDYLVPADWIAASDSESDILWVVDGERLRIWRENDYVLFDGVAAEQRPFAQIVDLLIRNKLPPAALRYGRTEEPPLAVHEARLLRKLPPDISRWLSLVVPYLRHRLALASDEPDIQRLLRCPGRLYVDRTHVDLVAGIDAISLAARRAGLDRDPGWQSRYGRVITFYFE